MQELVAADPSRTIRLFKSHEEQADADLRYWRGQPVAEKVNGGCGASSSILPQFTRSI